MVPFFSAVMCWLQLETVLEKCAKPLSEKNAANSDFNGVIVVIY